MKGAVVGSSTVVAVGAASLLGVLGLLGLHPEPALTRDSFGKPKHMEAAGRAAPEDVPVVRDTHLASHTAGPHIATCCPETAPQPAGWEAACTIITQPFSPPSPADRPEMFTIVVTTYKGHATLANTIGSWRRTGLLDHPRLEEVLFHCNMCSCADLELIENLMNGTAYRVVCAEANRLHPQALLFALRAVVTPLVLLTENDRPVVPRVNETLAEAAVRVGRFLDVSLETVANESTPYVFLERVISASDDALFRTLEERARHVQMEQQARQIETKSRKPVFDFYKDVIQNRTDWSRCWHHCFRWSFATLSERSLYANQCRKMQKWARRGKTVKLIKQWGNCQWMVCREWDMWTRGTQDDIGMCLSTWMRNQDMGEFRSRIISVNGNATVGGPLTCFRQSTWSNGPALFRVSWYLDTIVRRMCQFPDQAGLRFRSRSPHFGWYGRQMEYFLSRVFAKEQYPMCRGDGIMDHIEIESFDGDSVSR